MTSLAAVVLAHQDALHVKRLLAALADVPVFLHCDVKAARDVAETMQEGAGPHVRLMPRTSGTLGSWSLVRIELDGLRAALRETAAQHIMVLSGSDYPLMSVEEMHVALEPWRNQSYMFNVPIPFGDWDTPRHPDGGRWRTEHQFLHRGDDLLFVRGIPLRLPWRRGLPPGLIVRASSQWKIYTRADAERLVRLVDTRPDLVAFWRSTLVPDESFAASMLSSVALVGGPPLPDCFDAPWFLRWSAPEAHHPDWLGLDDFELIAAARTAPPGLPQELGVSSDEPHQALFARKFSTARSSTLLDRIDTELRR